MESRPNKNFIKLQHSFRGGINLEQYLQNMQTEEKLAESGPSLTKGSKTSAPSTTDDSAGVSGTIPSTISSTTVPVTLENIESEKKNKHNKCKKLYVMDDEEMHLIKYPPEDFSKVDIYPEECECDRCILEVEKGVNGEFNDVDSAGDKTSKNIVRFGSFSDLNVNFDVSSEPISDIRKILNFSELFIPDTEVMKTLIKEFEEKNTQWPRYDEINQILDVSGEMNEGVSSMFDALVENCIENERIVEASNLKKENDTNEAIMGRENEHVLESVEVDMMEVQSVTPGKVHEVKSPEINSDSYLGTETIVAFESHKDIKNTKKDGDESGFIGFDSQGMPTEIKIKKEINEEALSNDAQEVKVEADGYDTDFEFISSGVFDEIS